MKLLTKRNIMIAFSIIVLLVIIFYILPVSIPIILALLTALFLDPLVKWVEVRFKWKRKVSVIVNFIVFVGISVLFLFYTVTTLIGKIVHFTKEIPNYLNSLSSVWINTQSKLFQYTVGMPEDILAMLENEFNEIIESIRISIITLLSYDRILALISDIPNFLVSFIVFMIALFLFMLELPNLKKTFYFHLTEATAEKVHYMMNRLRYVILGFVKAQLLVSLIILVVSFIGLLMIIPKYAVVMALVIWIIDIIPILGSIIILAPWSIYQYISGDIAMGTKLAILAVILLVIRRTIEPKVMGSQIGLSPLPTLIAMFIGLKLFGVLGFFIGPLLVILFNTAREAGIIKLNFKI
ncbi:MULTISPECIES: sporulation integral membrane protein YtvI [unclassified Sporosarcina]|uniref:sporulation integral membrane protein YtvI n=1 Tax=unclassified Sporosarcina TaxID=2647733 RepID=UPI000C166218|nr:MULTISPECIES: sporulation integral membrane protein YtvI [unclassified Sporosarcina]PID00061.1 sporulation integral membrane protein YtvI [Sporosarcina sp. P29]PID06742.1 sporulation integral membrane protein YtvI [Sporosarcina sp. P30]PID09937.1 sporulation integral membrane protein YtvI [Sporosarcina sp. P31]PID13516.1 sporulation integral membrane protein YtvI [Sporosarcina sp. P32b]